MKKTQIIFKTMALALLMLSVACGSNQQKSGKAAVDFDKLTFVELMEQAGEEQVQAWYDCDSRLDEDEVAARGAELKKQKKLICFDLDGTVTNHRTPLTPENKAVMDRLVANPEYKVIMVGAGNARRIFDQMGGYPVDIVANYGMQEATVVNGEFTEVRNDQCQVDREFFLKTSQIVRDRYGFTEYAGEPVEFHPAGMVTLGLLGSKAKIEDKLVFDPDKSKRRAIYKDVCELFKGYAVFIGGTTSFDITQIQYNKYDAVMNYAHKHGYTRDQVLFVGDDFGDGGGDSHIRLAGMDYIHITDFTKLPERMSFLY